LDVPTSLGNMDEALSMKRILLLAALALSLHGQILRPILAGPIPAVSSGPITKDDTAVLSYSNGGTSTANVNSTGPHGLAVVFMFTDGGSAPVCTYDGVSMGANVKNGAFNTNPAASGVEYIFVMTGIPTGTKTVNCTTMAGAFGSFGRVVTYLNAKQTGQPDNSAYVTGTSTNATPTVFTFGITTVANNSAVIATFVGTGNGITDSPSTNGTYLGNDGFLTYQWTATSNVTPAGVFNFEAWGFGGQEVYDSIGVSLAPF